MFKHIGEVKLYIQYKGIVISDILKNKLLNGYDCNHIKVNKLFFNIIDNKNNVPIYARIVDHNGYEIYEKNDEFYINVDGEEYNLRFNAKVASYNTIIGSKRAGDIARTKGHSHMAITMNHFCIYFHENKKCKFCSINQWPTNTESTLLELIEVIYCYQQNKEVKYISITGGTINHEDKGVLNIIRFIKKMRERGIVLPVSVECEPLNDENLFEQLKEVGVTSMSINLEMLDDDTRKRIMPGKGIIPFDTYLKSWKTAVRIFGKNQVFTNILMNSISKKNCMDRLETIISCGVIPSIGLLIPDKGSELYEYPYLDIESQKEFHEYNTKLLVNYGLNPYEVKSGCQKNGAYTPINEYYKYYYEREKK